MTKRVTSVHADTLTWRYMGVSAVTPVLNLAKQPQEIEGVGGA